MMNLEFARQAGGTTVSSRRLLVWFKTHPEAADTERGIAEFWLNLPVRVVRRELEKLLLLGVVRRLGLDRRAAAPVYRLAEDPAVMRLLTEMA